MQRMSLRGAFLVVALLTALSWGLVALDASLTGRLSPVAFATAVSFTLMLVAWPFVAGLRRREGHWQHAHVCRECGGERWPGGDFGFCLRCGGTRTVAGTGF